MKRTSILLVFLATLICCQNKKTETRTETVATRNLCNSIYYWKTTFIWKENSWRQAMRFALKVRIWRKYSKLKNSWKVNYLIIRLFFIIWTVIILSDPIFENTFVKYLRNTNDTEIVNYLLLAKRCELTRPKWVNSSDKWWYPNKEDIKTGNDLQSIIDEAIAYK